jgi:hypothetical protein
MPRGRPYTWVRDQSNGPVIIEREPHVRTTRPARHRKQTKRLTFGFKFVNPFKPRKRDVRVIHQEIHRGRQRADRPEFFDVREREREREPRRSEESASMSRAPHRDEFVPLPPRIPVHHQGPDPIIEVPPPNPRRTPEVHQGQRNPFEFPMNHPPGRAYEPERVIERERDRRRNADRLARQEARRRREAEEEAERVRLEAERVRLAAIRERERRRRAQEITQQMERMAINEREKRGEAEEEARRLAAEAADAEARARQAEAALLLERRLAERERADRERQRQAEIEDRAEADAWGRRRRSVHIQQDLSPLGDRGAEVLRQAQAQEAERRRRESDILYRMERNRYRDVPRRQRSLTLFENGDDRWRYRSI